MTRIIIKNLLAYLFGVILSISLLAMLLANQHRDYLVSGLEYNLEHLEAHDNSSSELFLRKRAVRHFKELEHALNKTFISCDKKTRKLIQKAKIYIPVNTLPNC